MNSDFMFLSNVPHQQTMVAAIPFHPYPCTPDQIAKQPTLTSTGSFRDYDGSVMMYTSTTSVAFNKSSVPYNSDPCLNDIKVEDPSIVIPDFDHFPSSIEQDVTSANQNPLRSAIFDKILNSYPELQRKLKRSHHAARKFCDQRSDCLYDQKEKSLLSPTSDILEDELDSGYLSCSDNSSMNSSGSVSPDIVRVKSMRDVVDYITVNSSGMHNVADLSAGHRYGELEKLCVLNSDLTLAEPVSGLKKYQCTICGKSYKGNTNLNYHMATHTGLRPHKCSICGKAFTQKSTLRTHIRVHTGERPYKCSTCSRAFADYSTCMKHERIHTGERPYACPVCGKCFAQSGNMIRHKQIHDKQ